MKFICLIIAVVCMDSCKPIHQINHEEISKTSISQCPEDGKCTFEVLKNQNLMVKKDEFGSRYKELVTGTNTVLKFIYKRNEISNTADSGYIEEIYIELDPNNIEVELQDSELHRAKLLFGRLCFCRGQTGYYEISSGHLSIKKLNVDRYQMTLDFKTNEVPQIISTITETFSMKE